MSSYTFRIRFFLRDDLRFDSDQQEIKLITLDNSAEISLEAHSESKISETNHLVMFGRGFGSKKEARKVGIRAKRALWLTGVDIRFGLDLGSDSPSGVITKKGKEVFEEKIGKEVLPDTHGLMVYQNGEEKVLINFEAEAQVKKPTSKFENSFSDHFFAKNMNKKVELGAELYNLSHFESSDRAKFLTLISVIEVLSPNLQSPEIVRIFVEKKILPLTDTLKSKLENEGWDSDRVNKEIQSFKSRLGYLKNRSFRQKVRHLIKKYLSNQKYLEKDAGDFFDKCYDLRSKMVHDGEIEEELNLRQYKDKLDKLVSDLITEMVNGKETDEQLGE